MLLFTVVSIALVPVAAAGSLGRVDLVGGTPEFESCLAEDRDDSSTCAWRFYHFLGDSMTDQGLTFANNPVHSSALTRRDDGLRVGARIDTFPFGPPPENLSGKAENTQFSPVLPRIFAGYAWGQSTHFGVGASLLPPIPVGGASALLAELDGSAAWTHEKLRFGGSLDLGYTLAHAPITASQDQFDDRDSFDNPDNLDPDTYEAICGANENGCVDTFKQLSVGMRGGVSAAFGKFAPYGTLGVNLVSSELTVMYDGTVWDLKALQPALSAGSTWAPIDRLLLSAGGTLATHGEGQSGDGSFGVNWKLDGAASWRFGAAD